MVIYIGDDATDEDAFQLIRQRDLGIGIRVAASGAATYATHYVRDCDETRAFLDRLLNLLREESLVEGSS